MTEDSFIPGLDLAESFYSEAVRPILDKHFPGLVHAAALIGHGSEVLGLDDVMSTDHHWGPRLTLFLTEADHERYSQEIPDTLTARLPVEHRGFSTNFGEPGEDGSRLLEAGRPGAINHRVECQTIASFWKGALAFDVSEEPSAADWLTFPSQMLRALTSGRVFHDDIGLEQMRQRFAFYPHDVWIYMLASGWKRISQEDAFVGRTGVRSDDAGSRIIAARLANDLIRLAYLMERRYAPYTKWLGTDFRRLECFEKLSPKLEAALDAGSWEPRSQAIASACETLADMQNRLALAESVPTTATPFHNRPFRVIGAEKIATSMVQTITDPIVRKIADKGLIGNIDQISDGTDFRHPGWRRRLLTLYEDHG